MLELPLGGGSGEWNIQRMPEAVSEGVFGAREPLRRLQRLSQQFLPTRLRFTALCIELNSNWNCALDIFESRQRLQIVVGLHDQP